ncbi:hypothetical protein ACOACO_12715 [Nocardioides sp. CPCC 205120]|uniref:hypothetical protein n=1 Tax=Nocardioides sp. CPCC 205120 TaxID=3406462 RepID=UPI003B5008BA
MRVTSVDLGPMYAARVQHVWVDITGQWEQPRPGVVMMWRQRRGKRFGWDAWVVWLEPGTDQRPDARMEQAWVDSRLVRTLDQWPAQEGAITPP